MTFSNIGLHNLTQPGLDAIQFSLMGMALVFGGLLVIALYISLLPRLLQLTTPKPKPVMTAEKADGDTREEEILLAIATALHLHNNFPDGDERITWKSHGDMETPSPWLVSGRMRGLNSRKLTTTWNR